VAKLKLVAKRTLPIPSRLIQKALASWIETERSDFAAHLDTARVMWRKHRELVEAPDFPEPLRAAYVNTYKCEPGDEDSIEDTALASDLSERLLPAVVETARQWVLRSAGVEEADTVMLMKMGITLEDGG